MKLSPEEWRKRLTDLQYRVLRNGETEPGGSGQYLHYDRPGRYLCAGCETPLFDFQAKYDSGTGWPSFSVAIEANIERREDHLYGMRRFEVLCATCQGHLGHVFREDENVSGERFCINSAALRHAAPTENAPF